MALPLELSGNSGVEQFDVYDTPTITPRWRKWRRAFDYFLMAKGVTSAAQKKALLLHLAGPGAVCITVS